MCCEAICDGCDATRSFDTGAESVLTGFDNNDGVTRPLDNDSDDETVRGARRDCLVGGGDGIADDDDEDVESEIDDEDDEFDAISRRKAVADSLRSACAALIGTEAARCCAFDARADGASSSLVESLDSSSTLLDATTADAARERAGARCDDAPSLSESHKSTTTARAARDAARLPASRDDFTLIKPICSRLACERACALRPSACTGGVGFANGTHGTAGCV